MSYKDPKKEKEYQKKYRETHREEELKRSKKCRENNPEYQKEYQKKYREKNKKKLREERKRKYPEKRREYQRKYYQNHKEEILKKDKKWRENNSEKVKEWHKNYRKCPENKEKRNLYNRKKRRKNPLQKLSESISTGISSSLKSNNLSKNRIHYENLIINTFQEIIEHLEKNFLPGMALKNYGRGGWHIHHIIPKEFFKFTSIDDVEFKYMWSTDNLIPLWEKDNIKKGDKVTLWGKEINARFIEEQYFSKITYEKGS